MYESKACPQRVIPYCRSGTKKDLYMHIKVTVGRYFLNLRRIPQILDSFLNVDKYDNSNYGVHPIKNKKIHILYVGNVFVANFNNSIER